MKKLIDVIHENNCDNYLIFINDEKQIPIVSFYHGLYLINCGKEIYEITVKNIISCTIEKDARFDENNLVIHVKYNN